MENVANMNIGVKDDKDKPRMDLLPPDALVDIAKVFTAGANKYSDRNWERGLDWGRIYGALQRHLNAFWSGEDIDDEWGYNHLAHAGCCMLMLLASYKRKIGKDDRLVSTEENLHRIEEQLFEKGKYLSNKEEESSKDSSFKEDVQKKDTNPSNDKNISNIKHKDFGFMSISYPFHLKNKKYIIDVSGFYEYSTAHYRYYIKITDTDYNKTSSFTLTSTAVLSEHDLRAKTLDILERNIPKYHKEITCAL